MTNHPPMSMRAPVGRSDLLRMLAIPERPQRLAELAFLAERVIRPPMSVAGQEMTVPASGLSAATADDSAPETAPAAAPFWRAVRFETRPELTTSSIANTTIATSATDAGILNLRPPDYKPLATHAEILTGLRRHAAVAKSTRELDLSDAVRRISRGEMPWPVTYRRKRAWGDAVQIIQDRSPRLMPYWHDQDIVTAAMLRVYPGQRTTIAFGFDLGPSLRIVHPEKNTQYTLPPPGVPVVVLGDLGVLRTDALDSRRFWYDLGRQLRDQGCPAYALVPWPLAIVPLELQHLWHVMPWGVGATEAMDPVYQGSRLDRLLAMIAPAVRLEPGLLRAIRLLDPELADDPGW